MQFTCSYLIMVASRVSSCGRKSSRSSLSSLLQNVARSTKFSREDVAMKNTSFTSCMDTHPKQNRFLWMYHTFLQPVQPKVSFLLSYKNVLLVLLILNISRSQPINTYSTGSRSSSYSVLTKTHSFDPVTNQ